MTGSQNPRRQSPVGRPGMRDLLRIAGTHFWLKAIGTTAIMTSFFVAYFHLLRHPAFPVTLMPLTAIDRWIGFQPWALPLYLSLWFYVCLPPTLMTSRSELVRFGVGISGVCLAGLTIFYFWPTAVPSMALDYSSAPGFEMLRGIDASGNACPSLHVATAVFAAIWLDRVLPRLGFGTLSRAFSVIWCGLIVYSTMAVKQHVLLDVLGGAPLGAVGAVLSQSRLLVPAAWGRRVRAGGQCP